MTWADDGYSCYPWWRDGDDAQRVPWPERTQLPTLGNGETWDYTEVACMREQAWAIQEGLA